jgi:aspartyl-tRNA(Asn)/glutamyl-tRNA(Gln) amidotransferase subunit A
MAEPFELTVAQAAEQIKGRALSPVDLVQSLLRRADLLEPVLKVWVTLDREGALDAARQREQEVARGIYRGPLHGIPVGIKDIFYTAGMKTTACSRVYADFVPSYDATAVARLREAGAIILGKTVTTEFATFDPPPTVNPWDPAHTPGGSSSGSAVGVAACMFPAALGSQTAGSTCRPAAYNGIVGFKPTYGRVSRYGVIPVSWSLDTVGILTRTVEDAAILLSAIAGYDPNDPSASREPVPDYRGALHTLTTGPVIGLVRELFQHADGEVRGHTEEVVNRLVRAGAKVEEVPLPHSLQLILSAHRVILAVECAAFHEGLFREHAHLYSPKIRALIEAGMLVPGVQYVQAQRLRRMVRRDLEGLLRRVDVLLTPATPSPAPRDLTTTGDPMFQIPWTFCGFPTIVLPSGLSRSGLPLGIQLIGAPFAEGRLLAVAHWCEATLAVRLSPPLPRGAGPRP